MLTPSDIKQIQKGITIAVEKAVETKTRKIVREELTQARGEIRKETREMIKEELSPVKEDIAQIRKDIKTIVNFFDNEYMELRKRVERIEKHLNLSPAL